MRTERNVLDSDGTLVLCVGPPAGGTALTCRFAAEHGKPLLLVDLAHETEPERAAAWIGTCGLRVLNVAGPRESSHPGVETMPTRYLGRLLAMLRHGG